MTNVKVPKFKTVFEIDPHTDLTVPSSGDAYLSQYAYREDCMILWSKGLDVIKSSSFERAYQRGMGTDHKIGRPKGSKVDIGIRYRIYVAIWAAQHALRLSGDFVECGVNTGITSLAVIDYIGESSFAARNFFLFDTFEGIPTNQMSELERQKATDKNKRFYEECYDSVSRTFSEYEFVQLVRGAVPESLSLVSIERVSYLHLDMNIAYPEVEALSYFWEKIVHGGVVLLDDYGWNGHRPQRIAIDNLARTLGTAVLELPTGQGLLIKTGD